MSVWEILIGVFLLQAVACFIREKMHYASIEKREQKLTEIEVTTTKICPYDNVDTVLALGSVVLVEDAPRVLLSSVVSMAGGEVSSYSKFLDRARREAVLRMIESEPKARAFYNLRLDTTYLNQGDSSSIEACAYATAIIPR